MFDGLVMFGNAVVGYLNPVSLTLAFGATLLGVVAGCMPGLSATLVITLLTTLTLKMQPNQAILVLVCAYNGAIYGGSRTAILLNIPGTAANAAACIDGYQLARQGQAGRAMGIATTGSVVGTLFGLVCLALFTPMLGEVALSFGAFEFFWLALLGVVMSGNVVAADPLKGWLAGFLGLFVAGIGQEGMYAYERFSFGNAEAEALVGIHAFLADAGDEQAEKAREPALERVGSDHVARHDDAEECEPEELEGAEAQRHFAQHRGEQRQADEAEQRAGTTEPVVAIPMARPACPWRASW